MISRRKFFSNAAVAAGAAALGAATRSVKGADSVGQSPEDPEKINDHAQSDQQDYPPGEPRQRLYSSNHTQRIDAAL
jgi:hypothetical protein